MADVNDVYVTLTENEENIPKTSKSSTIIYRPTGESVEETLIVSNKIVSDLEDRCTELERFTNKTYTTYTYTPNISDIHVQSISTLPLVKTLNDTTNIYRNFLNDINVIYYDFYLWFEINKNPFEATSRKKLTATLRQNGTDLYTITLCTSDDILYPRKGFHLIRFNRLQTDTLNTGIFGSDKSTDGKFVYNGGDLEIAIDCKNINGSTQTNIDTTIVIIDIKMTCGKCVFTS